VFVTLGGVVLIALHINNKTKASVDGTTVGLFAICILPWLSELLTSLELPGGWKIHFRDLVRKQEEQNEILKKLTLIFRLFVSEWQLHHLAKLASGEPMPLIRDATTPFYERDLRGLRELGLIEGRIGDFFRKGGDARSYLRVTELGRLFLVEATPLLSRTQSPLDAE